MFDIDAYLNELKIKEVPAPPSLVERTLSACDEARNKKLARTKRLNIFRKALIALPAAALLAVGIFIGATFFPDRGAVAPAASAYYTVDINPSIGVAVDEAGTVTGVWGQNDDGVNLTEQLHCVGQPVTDAIREIIRAADEAGYLRDGEQYVLIGCFGDSDAQTQAAISELQNRLEDEFGDMVSLLMISGTLEDKELADEMNVSPGLLKLSRMAGDVELTGQAKIADIVDQVNENRQNQLSAPVLSADGGDGGIRLTWTALDFSAMGYTGKVSYHIVTGDSPAQIQDLGAGTLETLSFYTNEEQPLSLFIDPDAAGIPAGEMKYYGIYVQYSGSTYVVSNAVAYRIPALVTPGPTAAPTPSATPQPTPSPTPAPTAAPVTAKVTGRISGEYVVLNWQKEESGDLSGYKIVASETNPNPKYPDDGYLKYITDRDKTGISLYEGYGGLKAGHSYYFSVTYLYANGQAVAANAVRLTVPQKTQATATPASPADYPVSAISGSIEGTTVSLSWTQISDSRFAGYKVMYSFSDATPVYGESGCDYTQYITNAATTGCSLEATSLKGYTPDAPCYFSITVLYDGGNVKAPGNVITLQMPAQQAEPYVSTDITGYSWNGENTAVNLSWNAITDSRLEGYKVMCSFTDSTPVYGESGCQYAYWITDASTANCAVSLDFLDDLAGYAPDATCYFSITALYESHSVKMAGNTVSLAMPGESES